MTPTPYARADALQLAALTLNTLARQRAADASTARDSIAADVAQSEADALDAGSQALAALARDARACRLLNGVDDPRDDHAERALDAALRSRRPFSL